jgi:hypothetical protein
MTMMKIYCLITEKTNKATSAMYQYTKRKRLDLDDLDVFVLVCMMFTCQLFFLGSVAGINRIQLCTVVGRIIKLRK